MISKQSVAFAIILVLCAVALVHTWVLDDGQQLPVWVWLPLLGLWLWAMWQLRDPPKQKSKTFDFNPKRGLLYFLGGFVIFPIVALINALFGAELSFNSMIGFTLFSSVFGGIAGTFTEHV